MQKMNRQSQAGFISVDYVHFLLILLVLGLVAGFVFGGLFVRILLVALVAGPIALFLYSDWASTLRPGDIVRIQRWEHRGKLAVVAPHHSPDNEDDVSVIPCWQDDLEEVEYSQRGEFVEKVLKWGIPQRMPQETWSIEQLKEVCREHSLRNYTLLAYPGRVRSWDEVAIVVPKVYTYLRSVDGLSRQEMEKVWYARYARGCPPILVAVLAGEREVEVGCRGDEGKRTFRFMAEAGHVYEFISETGESLDSSTESVVQGAIRLVDAATDRVIEEQRI
ncbi:hypothetical protein ACFL0I_02620 [Gemmatimonadota bacterium]